MVDPSDGSITHASRQLLSPLPPPLGSPVIGKGKFFLENGRTIRLERFVCFTDWHDGGIGTPTPPLDNLMNEGITFVIRKFQCRLTDTPVGQRAVMIGRRKSPYDTIDKVMKRLDLIMNVMEAMNFIPVDVH